LSSDTRDTKKELLNAAVDLFFEKGYASTTIREIGRKAGISNSLIYHYFKDKEAMLFEIVRLSIEDINSTLKDVDRKGLPPLECLREMVMAQTAIISSKRQKESKILFSEYQWITGRKRSIIKKSQRSVYELYLRKFKELRKNGLTNDIDPTVLTFSVFGVIFWFFRWYKEGGRLNKVEVADNLCRFIFQGILKNSESFHITEETVK